VVIAELDVVAGERVAAAIRDLDGRAACVPADVTRPDTLTAMVATVEAQFGPPDVLVNNAGIAVFGDPLELTDDDWRRCLGVDLDGVWFATRAVLPSMLARGAGSIVNLASVHSFQIIPHCFPYPVAKHGVIGLTRALAIEYAPVGIRVNAVCPSYVETAIAADYYATFPDPAAERRRVEELHPVRRTAQPDEVAAAIAFLAADECGFMTGVSLMVDGGRSVLYHDVA